MVAVSPTCRVTIDADLCCGSGECVMAAPDIFEIGPEGTAQFIRGAESGIVSAELAGSVCSQCPSQCIHSEPHELLRPPDNALQ